MTTQSQRIYAMLHGTEAEKEEMDRLMETNKAAFNRLVLSIWNRSFVPNLSRKEDEK